MSRPHTHSLPDGTRCPDCGAALERVHRDLLDRWVSLFRSVHRYRCVNPACHWDGLLGRESLGAPPHSASVWRSRMIWFAIGAFTAVGALLGARQVMRLQAQTELAQQTPPGLGGAEAQSRATPAGIDFDGEPLPGSDVRMAKNPSPLNLRRSCAWGVPGGNPYRGTVEQALSAARLPPEVVRQISEMAARGWAREQVEITRAGIRTVDQRRSFDGTIRAMGFGNTLCFNTRVNFPAGHVEYATLYEAADHSGQTYSVMVPFVCGNVSVLGERGERDEIDGNGVPEPGSWALALLALAALAWSRRRRPPGAGA